MDSILQFVGEKLIPFLFSAIIVVSSSFLVFFVAHEKIRIFLHIERKKRKESILERWRRRRKFAKENRKKLERDVFL